MGLDLLQTILGDEIIIVSLPVAGYSYYTKISCVETNTVNVLEEGSRFTCVLLKNLINSTNPA